MSTSCRVCGFELPVSEICPDCGEDHRGWVARLRTATPPPTLAEQDAEIRRMQAEIARQSGALTEESVRLSQHRAASRTGQVVITETRERVARGLMELSAAGTELDVAALGIVAVRSRALLERLRADVARGEPAPPRPLPALTAATVDPESGMLVGRAAGQIVAWSPDRALRPSWSIASPGDGAIRFGGASHARRLLLVGEETVAVIDTRDGRTRWTWTGKLLDCWGDFALVATADRLEVRSLADGGRPVDFPAEGVERGHILPAGLLVWSARQGLVLFALDGRQLGAGRFSGAVILSEDRATVMAFPMLLRLPTLQPVVGLTRPAKDSVTTYFLDDRLLIGLGPRLLVWRLAEGGAPVGIDLPSPAVAVSRSEDVIVVDTAQGALAFSLANGPPRRLDSFDTARVLAQRSLPRAPTRFRFSTSPPAGCERLDRTRGGPREKAELCHELAAFAAGRARAAEGEAREMACGLLRDALGVEAEMLTHVANAYAARLAETSDAPDLVPFERLLDWVLAPMMMVDALPRSLPDALDPASSRRVRGLLAACAEAVLTAVGERLSHRALRGEAEDGEIERSIALLRAIRTLVLSRAPGLGWAGLNELMARWKALGQQVHELADVAVATRALGRLADASTAVRGAGASADNVALERLGRSIGDLAARSAADAEIDALLAPEDVQQRIAEGMERVRRELGTRPPS
ncbi:MAG: hypothetical protein Q8P18_05615 [Pseudomonadota bacterium]|nr:hypothetical protein [Pseudomonadota bacterium]